MAQKCNSFILSINKYFLGACSVTGAGNTAATKADLEPAFVEATSYCTHFLPKWVDGWLKPTAPLYGQPLRGPRRYSSLSKSDKLSTIVWLVSCFSKHTLPTSPPQLSSHCLQCPLVHLACLNPLILSRTSPFSSSTCGALVSYKQTSQFYHIVWVPGWCLFQFSSPFHLMPYLPFNRFLVKAFDSLNSKAPWHCWGYINHYSRAYIQRLSKSSTTWKA